MKLNRYGKAKILTIEEIQLLFDHAQNIRDKALFAVMLFSACRVREAVTLHTSDIYDRQRNVRPEFNLRKGNTKGKLATRTIPVLNELRIILEEYQPLAGETYLFPAEGNSQKDHLHWDSAMRILKRTCRKLGIEGASSHSFRRTALTQMSNAGIPLRIIQEISGHRNLEQLQKYLEVNPEQVRGAIASLSMLAPVSVKQSVESCNEGITTINEKKVNDTLR